MRNTDRKVTNDPIIGRILATMEEKGVNQQEVTQHLGLGNGAFTRWKYNNGKSYMQYLSRIADYLGVSRNYLLKGINEVNEDEKLSDKEQTLLELFRNLKIVEQDIFLRQLIGYTKLTET